MFEKDENRKICEGCRTGNYYLCSSFPGRAKQHADQEIRYRKWRASSKERSRRQSQVYRREEESYS